MKRCSMKLCNYSLYNIKHNTKLYFCPQALRSFKLTITVDPKYHPKIIGRKGAIITQIRNEHEVNIQFPEKNDENQVTDWSLKTNKAKNIFL